MTALEPTIRRAIPLRGMRGTIARRMVESLQTAAQLTLNSHAAAGPLTALRDELRAQPGLADVGYADLLVRAAALVLPNHPRINATVEDGEIREWEDVNVGVAVALPDGLVVPVVKGADRLDLAGLVQAIDVLEERATTGALEIADVTGGTFTVSNLGRWRIDSFTPVLNPPQVAILGVGRLDGQVGLSLTIDHRAVDGAPGAAFLTELSELLEAPEVLA